MRCSYLGTRLSRTEETSADVFERVKCLTDFVFGELEDGIAAGALIARVDQCVERKRVVLRRGNLFFDERAEDAELDRVERHILRVPHKYANYVKPFLDCKFLHRTAEP